MLGIFHPIKMLIKDVEIQLMKTFYKSVYLSLTDLIFSTNRSLGCKESANICPLGKLPG